MCVITMKTMTEAQRARKTLGAEGINVEITGLDSSFTPKGCAYGITLPCHYVKEAKRLMAEKRVSFGDVIGV